ncbi:hypothetical protein Afil01_17320 [Actinorhabdospora filicis]|uniref:Phosphatidic acid phosphatase type 2/haloperoxidase domain-containing protein n=1 Tax=Actinorhabdospora filicis TaxID=1785913 RepID=A0A9W6W9S8_9ACTN|nr:phosphatase PAP2 family protein [Actinorhabdospora filicis]GLZ76925.1 hypothetical protein Afil01_17320 [Actinorhabdospora filicis]
MTRPYAPRPRWWVDVAAVLFCLAFVAGLMLLLSEVTWAVRMDVAIRDWVDSHRPAPMFWLARILNFLGQGTPLAVLTGLAAAYLAYRKKTIRPLVVFVAAYFAVGGVIGPIKLWTDRYAPHTLPGTEKLGPPYPTVEQSDFFQFDKAMSFPSGHTVNAVVWYALLLAFLVPLFPKLDRYRLWIRLVPPVIVTWSMTYLAFHWFTDVLAGLALGIIIERVFFRLPWERVPLPARLERREG